MSSRNRIIWIALVLALAPAILNAQAPTIQKRDEPASSMRDRLMPGVEAATLIAPVIDKTVKTEREVIQPAAATNRAGTPYMIAGAALFVAGLIVEGDAGTFLAVAGAGIGAYGLYLAFR
jgi:hypothetical protein